MNKFLMMAVALTAFSANAATTEPTTATTTPTATTTTTSATTTTATTEAAKKAPGCKEVREACTAAGYTTTKEGKDVTGKGLYANCLTPFLAGQTVEGLDTSKIKTDKIEACKAHRTDIVAKAKEAKATAKASKAATTTAPATQAAPATTTP